MIRIIQLTLLMLFIGVWAMASDTSVKNAEGVEIWYDFDSYSQTASVTYRGNSSSDWEDEYTGKIVIPSKVVYQGTEYSVTSIGWNAFYNNGLTSVTIPESVTSIGGSAFSGCSGLTSVEFNAKNCTSMGSSGSPVFSGCTKLTNLIIGENVTNIPSYAFEDCSGLTSVTIPDGVTSIGESAFRDCSGLTSVTIPESVAEIGSSAFYGCSGLTSVTIGESVTEIGSKAFWECSGLTKVYYEGTIADWCGIVFGGDYSNPLSYAGRLYIDGKEVVKLVIPDGVTEIKPYAFDGFERLTKLTLPEGLTKIGESAFEGCISMTKANIPSTVEEIGKYAFSGCSAWEGDLVLPEKLTKVGYSAFYDCSGPEKVYYEGTIADWCSIEFGGEYSSPLRYAQHLYIDNEEVTDLVIPKGVTSIKNYAFYDCEGLISVTIPEGVTSIGSSAFYNCDGLTSVTIPEGVTSIGSYAFSGCSGLASVSLPSTLEDIGSGAFASCGNLQKVTCKAEVTPFIYSDTFSGQYVVALYVPSASIEDYKEAAYWKEFGSFLPSEEETFIISATATKGYVNGTGFHKKGSSIQLEVVPYSGYEFKQWSDGNTDNPRTIVVQDNASYSAVCGDITYTVSATGEHCTVIGNGEYKYGEVATLAVVVDNNYNFKGWSDGNTDNPRIMTITDDVYLSAIVSSQSDVVLYTVTTYADNGIVRGGGSYAEGAEVTLTAMPDKGYRFEQWSDGVKDNPRVITITEDIELTAEFVRQYTITATAENGTVQGAGTYDVGAEVTLTAVAIEGCEFKRWSDGNTDNPRTVIVEGDASYNAICGEMTYTVSVTGENCTVIGTGEYKYGESVMLLVLVDNNCNFMGWSDGSMDNPRTMTVTDDITLSVLVEVQQLAAQYTISANAENGKVEGTGIYDKGAEAILNAIPDEGYEFVGWSDGSTDNPRNVTVNANATYTALFEKKSYTVTVSAEHCTVIGTGEYEHGETAMVVIVVNNNYNFRGWSDGSMDNPRVITVTEDISLVALVESQQTQARYTISANAENGSVIGTGTYDKGTEVTLTAVPDEGYEFVGWSDGIMDNPRSVTVNANATYTALFEKTTYTVSVTAENCTVIGTGEYEYGTSVMLVVVVNSNYNFRGWSDGSMDNPRTLTVTEDISLAAVVESQLVQEKYTVTANAENGRVEGTGTYAYGTKVTLTAVANNGYQFVQWSDGVTDNPRGVVVTSDVTYTAEFAVQEYTVTANAENGTVEGTGTYTYGTKVTLTAVANDGYEFVQWSDGVTDNPRSVVVTSDVTYTAEFAVQEYTVTANAENGTVEGTGTYTYGTKVTLTAVANDGYEFVQWSDGVTDNPRSVVVTSDVTYTVEFAVQKYTVTANAENGTVEGTGTYTYGTEVTLTAVANDGYEFVQWSDGVTDNPRSVVVTSDVTYTAEFAVQEYTVTANAENGTVEGIGTYTYGTEVTLTAVANDGYEFVQWSDGVTDNPRSVVVTSDVTYTAEFAVQEYTVTANAENGRVEGTGTYAYGTKVTLTAVANDGYEFVQWSDGVTDNPRSVVVTSDVIYTAEFAVQKYTVTANAENGTVEGTGTYTYGTEVTLTAVANDGYEFVQWSDGVTDNPRIITITEDVLLEAMFEKGVSTAIDNDNTDNITVRLMGNTIEVEGIDDYTVYTISGQNLGKVERVERGIYIVVAKGKSYKVIAK